MSKAVITPGQGFFAPGYQPRQVILEDGSREVSTAATMQFVQGFPLAMDGATTDQGKLKSVTDAATDVFYGVNTLNVNTLRGRTSLGEFTTNRTGAVLQGIVTVRRSVFQDASSTSNPEVTVSPFTGFAGTNGFPVATDIGKTVDAIEVTSESTLGSVAILKWGVGGGSDTGFADVAVILDVRENDEVDLWLPGKIVNRTTSV